MKILTYILVLVGIMSMGSRAENNCYLFTLCLLKKKELRLYETDGWAKKTGECRSAKSTNNEPEEIQRSAEIARRQGGLNSKCREDGGKALIILQKTSHSFREDIRDFLKKYTKKSIILDEYLFNLMSNYKEIDV